MEPRPRMRQSGVVIGPRSGRMGYRDDREGVTGRVEAPKLLDQVRQRLRVKHYSLRTEQAYVGWNRRFILDNGKRHPREIGRAACGDRVCQYAESTVCDGSYKKKK